MKKYIFILMMIIPALFNSCKYEELPEFSGEDHVFFSYAYSSAAYNIIDSTIVKFGYDVIIKTDSTISIPVRVMGKIVDYDRPVNFIIVDTSSTAKTERDVVAIRENSLIPAGELVGKVFVKVKNTENLNDTSLVATIRLVDNDYFKTDYTKTLNYEINRNGDIVATEYRIWFDNGSDAPNMWTGTTKIYFDMIFGNYSNAKFSLMCQILPGCSREYFTYTPPENQMNVFSAKFPMGLLAAWAMALNTYLNDYKAEHGEPLCDEKGVEIKSGTMYT